MFTYAISAMSIGGSGTQVAISAEWEIHFGWNSVLTTRFLLRRMGEKAPSYYFIKNQTDSTFEMFDTSEYFGLYSHSSKLDPPLLRRFPPARGE